MNYSIELIKITENLKNYCNCLNCNDEATVQPYVERFLSVLARLFCWVDSECDTLLKSNRHEAIDVIDYETCGCDAFMEIKPYYYKGFDPSTLKVSIQAKTGAKRETMELDSDYWDYSFVDGTVIIDLSKYINPCCRMTCECSCETTYKLVLDYEAGYTSETLPPCVYDAMCHFLQIFIAYQNKCGTLEECENMDRLAVGAVLEQKSVDYIVRRWTVDETNIDRIYVRLINRWALQTLSSLSLCRRVPSDNYYITVRRRKECK